MNKEKEKMYKGYKDTYCSGYLNRYTFEFDFLPNVLPPLYKNGNIDDYVMTHPSEWKKILLKKGVRSDFGIDKLSVDVVYEDDYLLIINKPRGIIIHDDDKKKLNTLSNRVAKYYYDNGLNLCVRFAHRLDFDTTGLIIYVKDSLSFAYMNHFIENHQINRYYLALVEGNFKEKSGKINKNIGKNRHDSKKFIISKTGKEAITNYEVIKNYEGYSLVKLLLETGRTHQIRVHMASIGHPLLGDTLYGKKSNLIDRVALHSFKLSFIHLISNTVLYQYSKQPSSITKPKCMKPIFLERY